MSKLKILLAIVLIHFSGLSTALATTFDRGYLENFVKSAVEKNIIVPEQGKVVIEVATIDPRISLKPCFSSLSANIPEKHNGRNVNVKIVCADEAPWYIFVPVRIQTVVPVLVARERIAKGSLLEQSNVEVTFVDINQIKTERIKNHDSVIGVRTKRNLSKGTAITNKNVCFVCKGDHVTVIAQSALFQIKTYATALKDGGIGEQIPIKNNKSGRIVHGQVSAIKQVIINL